MDVDATEARYIKVFVDTLRVCARYRPKFGKGRLGGFTLEQFQEAYRPIRSTVGWVSILR